MVQGDELLLHIGSGSHLLRRAEQHADLTGAHLAEQLLFLCLRFSRVDICDLLRRDATGYELVAYIIVDIEFAVPVRGGEVAENHLRGTRLLRALPYLKDILGAGGSLAGFVVGQ